MYISNSRIGHFCRNQKNKKIVFLQLSLFLILFSLELSAATISSELPPSSLSAQEYSSLPASPETKRMAKPLLAKLASSSPGQFFDVIVMLTAPEKAVTFQKSVGPFEVSHEFSIFHGFAGKMTKPQIMALSNSQSVFHIQEDAQVKAFINDVKADFGINYASVNWRIKALTGAGVDICVIDTGVDTSHQQTDQHVVAFCNTVFPASGCNVASDGGAITSGEPAPFDDQGHGTSVVSAAAGDGNPNAANAGVAPQAGVAVAKVLDSSGSGSASAVIKGLEWCAGLPGVDVLNMSLGEIEHTSETDALTFASNCVANPAWSIGTMTCAHPSRPAKVVVAAAGNTGPAQKQIFSPGETKNAITVAATYNQAEGGNALAAFSSRGPTWDGQIKPDIAAPGVNVNTATAGTVNGYSNRSGTSFSAPIVTGVVALMREANPSLTPSGIKSIIMGTAQHWGDPGINIDWGAGLLDASASVQRALDPLAAVSPWTFPKHSYLTGHLFSGELSWGFPFQVNDPSLPIAATMIIGGDWICIWQILPFFGPNCSTSVTGGSIGVELDMELIAPGGGIIDSSACPGDPDTFCGISSWDLPLYGTAGRQETTTKKGPFGTGTYTLRVYRAPDPLGNFDASKAADFIVELQNSANVTVPPATVQAPSGLKATLVSRTQVNLQWSDNSANETKFRLERCTGKTCKFTTLSLTADLLSNAVNYIDNSVARNTTYQYRVKAINESVSPQVESAYSNILKVTTPK